MSLTEYEKHLHEVHKVKRFACDADGCDETFAAAKELRTHFDRRHHGQWHKCEDCGRSYTDMKMMENHIEKGTCADRVKKFHCNMVEGCV